MPGQCEMNAADDEQIIAAVLRGDTASFGAIVERYWSMAVALALGRIEDLGQAEDIAQESFTKAYIHLPRLRDPAHFAGWLSKIVAQQSANALRQRAREKAAYGGQRDSMEAAACLPAPSSNPGLTVEQTHFIRQTINRMPERLRRLIIMRFIAGFSSAQIARRLGERPGTVRVRLHRAYNMLRKDLASLLEEVGS